jgi:hypothetical protein
MMLFDGCYELMLQLMVQHFGEAATASLRRSKLMNASIDVMTGLVRPLGVMLMSMPSGKKGRTAGPSFELDHVPASISVPKVAYKVISQKFKRLHDLALTIPPVSEAVRGILAGYAAEFASMAERS